MQRRKIFLTLQRKIIGALAHLARARHWQCRGERFESAVLHTHSSESNFRFAFLLYP